MMRISRFWPAIAVFACLAAVCFQARSSSAQQPQPTATGVPDPGLTLQIAQHPVIGDDGSALQEVDLTVGSAYPVQVRLIEDHSTLAFDGFTGATPGLVVRIFPRLCGQPHSYDLYAVVDGAIAGGRSAAVFLCPEAVPTSTPPPSPVPRPTASPPPPPPAAAARPPSPAPPPPAPAAAPSRAVTQPGEPPVPPPPIEPPSLALSHGYVLAQPDDEEAAYAAASSVPLVRVLAIWLQGTDGNGQGDGAYQYVEIGNLGGAAQDLSGWSLQGDSGGISGLMFYFPTGFTLAPGDSCRVYVGHPAEGTCTDGGFALDRFWTDHGAATLWDDQGEAVDSLGY